MTRTIIAYFDDVPIAKRAAQDLARHVPGMRGEVFDARGGGVVHARVPDGRFDEVTAAL